MPILSDEKRLKNALKSNNKDKITKIYEEIYNQYVKLVAFQVGKYIADKETIKDITNDVFIAFFEYQSEISSSIKSFLCMSARNMSINYLKKNDKILYTDTEEEFVNEDALESAPTYKELIEDLKEVLSKEEVEIVLLHAVEGYSFKEIGEMLNIKANAANTRYFRALKKFKSASKAKKYEKR